VANQGPTFSLLLRTLACRLHNTRVLSKSMVQHIGQEVREHPRDFSPLRWGVNFTTTHMSLDVCFWRSFFAGKERKRVSMCGGRVGGTILDYPVSFLINPLSF
jgi:hypothetical protein